MKTTKDLKQMIKEPVSKEWFKKHGNPMHKALEKAKSHRNAEGKIVLKKPRRLTAEESAEKTKHWATTSKPVDHSDYQKRVGRAYND